MSAVEHDAPCCRMLIDANEGIHAQTPPLDRLCWSGRGRRRGAHRTPADCGTQLAAPPAPRSMACHKWLRRGAGATRSNRAVARRALAGGRPGHRARRHAAWAARAVGRGGVPNGPAPRCPQAPRRRSRTRRATRPRSRPGRAVTGRVVTGRVSRTECGLRATRATRAGQVAARATWPTGRQITRATTSPTTRPMSPPGPPTTPAAARPAPPRDAAAQSTVQVRRGDCLWLLAARRLPPGAPDGQIAAYWPRWYAANREVVGTDPGLLQPGELLTVPAPPAPSSH